MHNAIHKAPELEARIACLRLLCLLCLLGLRLLRRRRRRGWVLLLRCCVSGDVLACYWRWRCWLRCFFRGVGVFF